MNTLRLEAFSPAEGVGIVRSGDELRLIRPPYSLRNSPVLDEGALIEAIERAGFVVSHHSEFKDWEQIIRFLDAEVSRVRQQLGYEIPAEINADDVFDIATADSLTDLFDCIEQDFLSKHQFDPAENILVNFLAHEVSRRFPELGIRAARMLKHIRAIRQCRTERRNVRMTDTRFSSLLSHGVYDQCLEISERIKARGSVFALTS